MHPAPAPPESMLYNFRIEVSKIRPRLKECPFALRLQHLFYMVFYLETVKRKSIKRKIIFFLFKKKYYNIPMYKCIYPCLLYDLPSVQ